MKPRVSGSTVTLGKTTMLKMLLAASALSVLWAGAAGAQGYYGGPPAPPYSVGGYGGGYGGGGCRFTIAGVHAGVTVLGIDVGGRVGASVPTDCGGDQGPVQPGPVAYAQPYAQPYGPPPQPYGAAQPYGYQGGYAQPVAYPAPQPYGYPPQPCGCQPVAYQPY